ncbi:MAG TPA: RNA polymerase sigma-54 factor [Acidobacteriaceae bacterium]
MVSLQPKLNLKVSQRQILTPGLMQMVSVLALNKLELKEMIQAEMAENPVLEELEENVPMLDHVAEAELQGAATERDKPDPFEEIDFGSYFQEYLDPGFRSPQNFEVNEKPSLENYLSQQGSLSDHLVWQLGSLNLAAAVRDATEYIVGNLNEDGYLHATAEELLAGYRSQILAERCSNAAALLSGAEERLALALSIVQTLDPIGVGARDLRECLLLQIRACRRDLLAQTRKRKRAREAEEEEANGHLALRASAPAQEGEPAEGAPASMPVAAANGHLDDAAHGGPAAVLEIAERIADKHLPLLQRRDLRELARAASTTIEQANEAFELIRTLDPRPGQRFNRPDARLIEPDVAFVKRDDVYVAVMDDDSVPTLRVNQGYRRLLKQGTAEKDVKDYVKERYRSALQLMRNIEQRKNTILRTCEVIVRRQVEFLEHGVEALKPMMIKEVAEEIGVHPSTVSRAVSNKYVHTPQGVYELRFFFSEGVSGPEGSATPLLLLKRKVKKLIEEEDPRKPLTDELITHMLQSQGIDVTRRTVAKYREDLRIPSTHQRRVRD